MSGRAAYHGTQTSRFGACQPCSIASCGGLHHPCGGCLDLVTPGGPRSYSTPSAPTLRNTPYISDSTLLLLSI